jgi:DNA-binding Lrp family transcriptional regulator
MRWTKEDDQNLRILRHDLRLTWREVGSMLNRSPECCSAHAWELRKHGKKRLEGEG